MMTGTVREVSCVCSRSTNEWSLSRFCSCLDPCVITTYLLQIQPALLCHTQSHHRMTTQNEFLISFLILVTKFMPINNQPLFLFYYYYSALRPVLAGTRAQSGDRYGLARCILGKFLRVVCHCFPLPLDVPTFAARCLHVSINTSAPSSEKWNCGWEWSDNFAEMTPFYAILGSFTCRKSATWVKWLYFPSEGRHAEDFFVWKIRQLQPRVNTLSRVPEASMLTTRPPKPAIFKQTYESWTYTI
jgi:hypothetical protein